MSEVSWLALIATSMTKIFIDQSPITSWQSPNILSRKTNKQKSVFYFVLNNCEICRAASGQARYEESSCLQGSRAGDTHGSISPYRSCICLQPPKKHRIPTSEEKTMALLPNEARCPGLIGNRNLLTRALFILVLTAWDFNSLFHCFCYYNREGCLLGFLLYECLYTQRLPAPNEMSLLKQ